MKSKGTAYLLWFLSFFGILGFHRFYLGKIGTGLIWFFTGGVLGWGALIDLFILGSLVDNYNTRRQMTGLHANQMAQNRQHAGAGYPQQYAQPYPGSYPPQYAPGSVPPQPYPGSYPPQYAPGSVPPQPYPGSYPPQPSPGSFAPQGAPASMPGATPAHLLPPPPPGWTPPGPASTPPTAAPSATERLTELKNLFDGGIITKEEFEVKKAEILRHV